MYQSSGGCSQKSFLVESYDLRSSVRAADANSSPPTAIAAATIAAPALRLADGAIFSSLETGFPKPIPQTVRMIISLPAAHQSKEVVRPGPRARTLDDPKWS